jgi:hypothetical protein
MADIEQMMSQHTSTSPLGIALGFGIGASNRTFGLGTKAFGPIQHDLENSNSH